MAFEPCDSGKSLLQLHIASVFPPVFEALNSSSSRQHRLIFCVGNLFDHLPLHPFCLLVSYSKERCAQLLILASHFNRLRSPPPILGQFLKGIKCQGLACHYVLCVLIERKVEEEGVHMRKNF